MMEDPEDNHHEMHGGGTSSIHVTVLDGLLNANALFAGLVFTGLSFASPGQQSLQDNPACDAGKDIARNLVVFEMLSFTCFLVSSLQAMGLKLAIAIINCKNVGRKCNDTPVRSVKTGADIHTLRKDTCPLCPQLQEESCTFQKEIDKLRHAFGCEISKLGHSFKKDIHKLQHSVRANIDCGKLMSGLLISALGSALGCLFLMLSMINLIQITLGLLSCGSIAPGRTVAVACLVIFVPAGLLIYLTNLIYALTY